MKIFISSAIHGMESFRDAVEVAAKDLGHDVVRAEDFVAAPASPRRACLQAVREADAVVLLLGARYGVVQTSGFSATHEEYREARERCPVLVFVQDGVSREPEQDRFVREVRDWAHGQYSASFQDPESLRSNATRGLHTLELAAATGPARPDEILQRATSMVPRDKRTYEAELAVAVAAGPGQSILRPHEIENEAFMEELTQSAIFGPHHVLDRRHGTDTKIEGHALVVVQRNASVFLDEQGSVRILVPACTADPSDPIVGFAVIEEEILERLEESLAFIAELLDRVDASHRLTHVVPVAGLVGADHLGWQTRAEHARSRGAVSIPLGGGPRIITALSPPARPRAALVAHGREMAQDLTILLRRARLGR